MVSKGAKHNKGAKHGKGVKQRKSVNRQGNKAGLPPGTPMFIGLQKRDETRIDLMRYDTKGIEVLRDVEVEAIDATAPGTTWVNVSGIHDLAVIGALGRVFGLHPLVLEDLVNTGQRSKTEVFSNYLFIVLKMMIYNASSQRVEVEHVSLIFGKTFVLSFMENESHIFNAIRERMMDPQSRIRSMGPDYLAYGLIDAVVDGYFTAIEQLGDLIEAFDERIITSSKSDDIQVIHRLKRNVLSLRKVVLPLRETIGMLRKSDQPLVQNETNMYLRDLYDHTVEIIDRLESFRDILSGMHDTYLSNAGARMNEIMKVLTIISTIFIPLSFLAGVYGMNFEHMPELKWPWAYQALWLLMITIGGGMLVVFKRKNWF